MREYWNYLRLRWAWAQQGAWGTVEKIGGFMGILFAVIIWSGGGAWIQSHGGESMTAFWLGVIPLATGFSVFLVRWVWSAYSVFRDSKKTHEAALHAKDEECRKRIAVAEKAAQAARQEFLELQSLTAGEGHRLAENIGREYAKLWRARGMPDEPGARMKCLIDAEILGVEHVPNGLDIVLSAARIAGASDPFQGWEKDYFFEFVNWAVTRKEGLPTFLDEIQLFHEWTDAFLAGQGPMNPPWTPMHENASVTSSCVVSVEYHPFSEEVSSSPAGELPPVSGDAETKDSRV